MIETPNFSMDLTGQTALVTGTTSGLGRRFAEVLAACGANVAVAGRRVDPPLRRSERGLPVRCARRGGRGRRPVRCGAVRHRGRR
mgnify:CR=1 FL=1